MAVKLALILSFLLTILACRKKDTVLIFDHSTNVLHEKVSCQVYAHVFGNQGLPDYCVTDPEAEVTDFENKLGQAFLADDSCQGLVWVEANNANKVAGTEYFVVLDDVLVPRQGAKTPHQRHWSLGLPKPDQNGSTEVTGDGTPTEIVHSICVVAKGRGGSVIH